MLPIGTWIEHPHFGRGRIADHDGTRYVCAFPGLGMREVESHEPGIRRVESAQEDPIKTALRDVLDEYGFGGTARLAGKWEGGEVVFRPADPAKKEHRLPIDQLLHKVVMVRDRLRVLEQKINAHKTLTSAEKVEMQQYITRCYGSLTSFNVLFRDEEDKLRGQIS